MELRGVRIGRSPLAPSRVRLTGTVSYDDRPQEPEEYWFDLPEESSESLSQSGNPWLACLIPLAVTLGEPLRLGLPVDRTLLDNVRELQQVWSRWYSHLAPVPVQAEAAQEVRPEQPGRAAAFFSGGVDSFFTLLQHGEGTGSSRVDEVLCVWGFDVPLEGDAAFARMRAGLGRAADELGSALIEVATNLRVTRWRQTDWPHLSHGCALAAVGLTLERRYRKVMIAASYTYAELHPWGSHALTDPLLSTSRTEISHDGAAFSRLMKTEVVARSEVAMRSLRVCWRSQSDGNCGGCEKCCRTMLGLDLVGALDRCATFRGARVDLKAVRRIYMTPSLAPYYRELRVRALGDGRKDIARAIERGFRRSGRIARWLRITGYLRPKRLWWRLAKPLEEMLLARCVT